jgi:hypothetical protein
MTIYSNTFFNPLTPDNLRRSIKSVKDAKDRLESARELFVRACPRLNALRFVRGMVIPCRVKQCKGKRT